MFNALAVTTMQWDDMVAYVRDAERTFRPDAAVRSTATFWLELADLEYQSVPDRRVLSKAHENRVRFFCNRSVAGLLELERLSQSLEGKRQGLAAHYQLEQALFADEEPPFEVAYHKLQVLMVTYGVDTSLDGVKRGDRPRRPAPATLPTDLFASARQKFRSGNIVGAEQYLRFLDQVITRMAHVVVLPPR